MNVLTIARFSDPQNAADLAKLQLLGGLVCDSEDGVAIPTANELIRWLRNIEQGKSESVEVYLNALIQDGGEAVSRLEGGRDEADAILYDETGVDLDEWIVRQTVEDEREMLEASTRKADGKRSTRSI